MDSDELIGLSCLPGFVSSAFCVSTFLTISWVLGKETISAEERDYTKIV